MSAAPIPAGTLAEMGVQPGELAPDLDHSVLVSPDFVELPIGAADPLDP